MSNAKKKIEGKGGILNIPFLYLDCFGDVDSWIKILGFLGTKRYYELVVGYRLR